MLHRMWILLMCCLVLAGCTPYIYGVPQPQWDQMTSGQRDEAIRGYNERERFREKARQEEAARQAREAEIRVAEARRQDELIRQRVEGIYAGTAGQFGDLIQVTLSVGQMMISWGYQNYQPVAFKIANGETRKIDVVAISSYYVKPDHTELFVRYQDGMLLIDGTDSSWDRAARLLFDQSWRHGAQTSINSKSRLDLKNVRVGIKIIPHLKQNTVR
ncbi:MAG: hypothetical protein PHI31_09995 [Desulfuromonadaceae bacterium]|nr:hypothetical protein [Desulfuromonadaceae bacterium]